MMRQIVGLPPLPASPSEPVYGGPAVLEPQPNINNPVTTMPVPGPNVAAPYPQAPLGNPAQSPMAMRQYLEQQNLMAQRMNQQRNPLAGPNPYMQQTIGPGLTPEGNLFNPMQQQQPYMPQGMTMDMPQTNQPMMQLPTQPPMGIQQQTFGQTMPTSNMTTDFGPQLLSALGKNTQQPMGMQQQAFGQTQPPMQLPQQQPMQQQPMGQFQQNNAQQMSNFQNQSQPAQNTQQNRGGMFGRRFGGGSFGGGGGGGGGGGLF